MNKPKAKCKRCNKEVCITEHFHFYRHNITKDVVCKGSSESFLTQTKPKNWNMTRTVDLKKENTISLLQSIPGSGPVAVESIVAELIDREQVFRKKVEDALKEIEEDERLGYPTATVVENAPLALVQCGLENQLRALRWVCSIMEGKR
jgi:hypothetical protein